MPVSNNSAAALLERVLLDHRNSLAVVQTLSLLATGNQPTVPVTLSLEDGSTQVFQLPSLGYLQQELARLEQNQLQLAGLGANGRAQVTQSNGTTRQVLTSTAAREPQPISQLTLPSRFITRSNWLFEDFLNPSLRVQLDLTSQVDAAAERAVIQRLLLVLDTPQKLTYFQENLQGRADLDYTQTIEDLTTQGIGWLTDEDVRAYPPTSVRYTGTFDVLDVVDEQVTEIVDGESVTLNRRFYRLSKLTYTDNLRRTVDSQVLQVGDQLLAGTDTVYRVATLDTARNLVRLERVSGYTAIRLGTDTLRFFGESAARKILEIPVGFQEYQIVFVKPVDPASEFVASSWSPGIAFYSDDLVTRVSGRGDVSLAEYFTTEVVDFSRALRAQAKERPVAALDGLVPDAPDLTTGTFQVTQINRHLSDAQTEQQIRRLQGDRVNLKADLARLDEAIETKKQELESGSFRSETDRLALNDELTRLRNEKGAKTNQLRTTVDQLSTLLSTGDPGTIKPKYQVLGMFPFAPAKLGSDGRPQENIGHIVQYRYLRTNGTANQAQDLAFTNPDGTTARAVFSPWVEVRTPLRSREYNTETGFYEWAAEDLESADTVNANQVAISIQRGEKVEIRARSINEAGWPQNPMLSPWSTSVTIEFPDDLPTGEENSFLADDVTAEQARLQFNQELDARGLDLHLADTLTRGDTYYAHRAQNIASGFNRDDGSTISLYEKLLELTQQVATLSAALTADRGTLAVYLRNNQTNERFPVTNQGVIDIFAGYYDELTSDRGAILTHQYTLELENSTASPLELASLLPGVLEELLPDSSTQEFTEQQYQRRRYDLTPLGLTGLDRTDADKRTGPAQPTGFQSAQVRSQFLYVRQKEVGLRRETFVVPTSFPTHFPYFTSTDPTARGGGVDTTPDANLWQGDAAGTGGGVLTEFAVHLDHPALTFLTVPDYDDPWKLIFPNPNTTDPDKLTTPPFAASTSGTATTQHTYQPITAFTSSWFGGGSTDIPVIGELLNTDATTWVSHYPAKLGFRESDRFLVGSRTCGAFLFLAPRGYDALLVPGSDYLATRTVQQGTENRVSIPLLFQFRLRDYHPNTASYPTGFAGGWVPSGTEPTQLTYEKRVGIDLFPVGGSLFSFDLKVSVKLKRDIN